MASYGAIAAAAICTCAAVLLAVWHIYMHLVNYTEPTYQRFIVRIIFMVPVRSFFLSLPLHAMYSFFQS